MPATAPSEPPSISSFRNAVRVADSRAASNAPTYLRLVTEEFSADAASEVGAVGVVAAEDVAGALIAGISAMTLGIVVVAFLAVLAIIFFFGKQIADMLRPIWIVGDDLANAVEWVTGWVDAIVGDVEAFMHSIVNDFFRGFVQLVGIAAQALGIPTIGDMQKFVSSVITPLAHSLGWVSGQLGELSQNITDLSLHLEARVHALWTTIGTIEAKVAQLGLDIAHIMTTLLWLAQQVSQIWAWLHWLYDKVTTLIGEVAYALEHIVNLEKDVHRLQKELQDINDWIANAERIIVPAAEAAAVMVILAPLIEAGPEAISNLERIGKDPCYCFSIPGSTGWMLYALVGDYVANHGI